MPRFVWTVRAYSPRDGGWVRVFCHFHNESQAWEAVILFWDMMVDAGDYKTLDVRRTIALH